MLEAYGKDNRCYHYIINSGKRLFWLRTRTGDSLESGVKPVADRMALSLDADGVSSPRYDAEQAIKQIDSQIGLYTRSHIALVGLYVGIAFLVTFPVIPLLFYLSMLPKDDWGTILRSESHRYIVLKKKRFKMNLVGAVVLTEQKLTVYCFRRHLVTLEKGQADHVGLASRLRRKILRIEKDDRTIDLLVSDPANWMVDIKNCLG